MSYSITFSTNIHTLTVVYFSQRPLLIYYMVSDLNILQSPQGAGGAPSF